MTMMDERRQLSYIAAQAADARLNVELETESSSSALIYLILNVCVTSD